MKVMVDPLILIRDNTNIQTWRTLTLTTHLGYMLRAAERIYGPRDPSFTILGIEYTVKDHPYIYYPLGYAEKYISIQLTQSCLNDKPRGCYQLAHECIHLLSPVAAGHAKVLEEGIATYFSRQYLHNIFGTDWSDSGRPSYNHASNLIQSLLQIDPKAIQVLRQHEPVISQITAELVSAHYPSLPEDTAIQLAQPFNRESTLETSAEPLQS